MSLLSMEMASQINEGSSVMEGQGKAETPNLKIHVLYLEPGQRGL